MKFFALLLAICAFLASSMAVKDDICALPHSVDGNGAAACLAYFPSWSYKADTNECVEFVFGGCGGNENRFSTKEECEEKCIEYMETEFEK